MLRLPVWPDPATNDGTDRVVGAGSAGELEQLAADAHADVDRARDQAIGYAAALTNYHARLAARAFPQIQETP